MMYLAAQVAKDEFMAEISLMKQLRGANLVMMLGMCGVPAGPSESEHLLLILE